MSIKKESQSQLPEHGIILAPPVCAKLVVQENRVCDKTGMKSSQGKMKLLSQVGLGEQGTWISH